MSVAPPGLIEIIRTPFAGEDIVAAIASPTALENLHMVLDPLVVEGFVTEMVADSSFREERTGVEGFLAAWQDWAGPYSSLRVEVEEIREIGDKLLTLVRQVGVPKGTTTEIADSSAAVWTLADGKLVRVEFHLDVEAAKRSAGLDG